MNKEKRAPAEGAKAVKGNTMILNVPGFEEELYITFPNRRLPVCEKCKGHFKTRDLCRMRKKHTSPPWNTVYICISLDSSCTDEHNMIKKGSFVANNVSWKPYEFKETSGILSKMPMCLDCKNKNYTGSSCRGGVNPHRHLPWSTVYIELSSLMSEVTTDIDPDFGISKKSLQEDSIVCAAEKMKSTREERISSMRLKRESPEVNHLAKKMKNDTTQGDTAEGAFECDEVDFDIKNIDKSRAFFVQISHSSYSIQWLDLDEEKAVAFATESRARNRIQSESIATGQPNFNSSLGNHISHDGYMSQDYYQHYGSRPQHQYAMHHQSSHPPYYYPYPPPPPPQDQYGSYYNSAYSNRAPAMHQHGYGTERYNSTPNWSHYNQQWMPQNQGWQPNSHPSWQEYQHGQDDQYHHQDAWSNRGNVQDYQASTVDRSYELSQSQEEYRSQEYNSRHQRQYDYQSPSKNSSDYEY